MGAVTCALCQQVTHHSVYEQCGPVAKTRAQSASKGKIASAAKALWNVSVDRSSGKDLGLDVDIDFANALLIVSIRDGLIAERNGRCRDRQVQAGDLIVAVNGFFGCADDLLRCCQAAGQLQLTLVRDDSVLEALRHVHPERRRARLFEDEADATYESEGLFVVPPDSL
mmetsp:Transcript_110717/g.319839  ORF Transcript_110717/g.319839 Transcript_110717/m.319839 type:complete len:169 (-) Transcript_110717:20-526(-)